MYKNYYVNQLTAGNPNNNHEVHTQDCYFVPSESNRIYLGSFSSCMDAVQVAKNFYTNVDGCATCCPNCHRG